MRENKRRTRRKKSPKHQTSLALRRSIYTVDQPEGGGGSKEVMMTADEEPQEPRKKHDVKRKTQVGHLVLLT